jgi:DNA-binding winged helix-turn-helix (wHTH) protein
VSGLGETSTGDPKPNRELEFRILGPVEVLDGGRPVRIGGLRRALLALLLVHANEPVSTERLIDALWDEQSPATAPKIIQNTVSQLRKLLGADALVTRGGGYELRVDPEHFDANRFEQLADEGRELPAAEAASRLSAADPRSRTSSTRRSHTARSHGSRSAASPRPRTSWTRGSSSGTTRSSWPSSAPSSSSSRCGSASAAS